MMFSKYNFISQDISEISDIAHLFADPDPKIENQAKLFFFEMNKKDN